MLSMLFGHTVHRCPFKVMSTEHRLIHRNTGVAGASDTVYHFVNARYTASHILFVQFQSNSKDSNFTNTLTGAGQAHVVAKANMSGVPENGINRVCNRCVWLHWARPC